MKKTSIKLRSSCGYQPAGDSRGFSDEGLFPYSSDEALDILNKELERRGLKDRLNQRMLKKLRQRGNGPVFKKWGHWCRYPSKERLIAWLDSRFSAPVRSTRELRRGLDAA